MDKSPEAFRTISEVAVHLETPAHVLRFWESRFPQIRPVKRAGGRRYYRPSDVSLLTGIKRLLHDEGMTIRGVQKILREQGVRHVAGLSSDVSIDEPDAETPYVDHVADAVLATVTTLPMPAARPGLTEAMAKAVDRMQQIDPDITPGIVEQAVPAQGALLLTPAPVDPANDLRPSLASNDTDQADADGAQAPDPNTQADADHPAPNPHADDLYLAKSFDGTTFDTSTFDANSVDVESVEPDSRQEVMAAAQRDERTTTAPSEAPDEEQDSADFDVDDFDNGPMTTLASRIRSLPPEASAASVGSQLLSIVERMQSLRDRMADAARSGRS